GLGVCDGATAIRFGLDVELGGVAVGLGQRALFERFGLGLKFDRVAVGLCQRPLPVSLRIGGTPYLGLELLLRQLGGSLCKCGLLLNHLLRRASLGERPSLRGACVGFLHLRRKSGLLDLGVALVLGAQRSGFLLAL